MSSANPADYNLTSHKSLYVQRMESWLHGLRPLAIAFAIPHALAIYSALLLLGGLLMKGLETTQEPLAALLLTLAWSAPFVFALPILTRF